MTRTRRWSLGAAVALVAVAVATTVPPAGATRYDQLSVSGRSKSTQSYPAIIQDAPMTTARKVDPAECDAAVYCDTVPFRVEIPTDMGPSDDYKLEVVLSWADDGSNLDIFMWDDKQTKEADPPPGPGQDGYTPTDQSDYTIIGDSAGTSQPEEFEIVTPNLVDYNLTILNYNGINTGYTITAWIVVEEFSAPFESLDPQRRPTGAAADTTPPRRPPTPSSNDDVEPGSAALGPLSDDDGSAAGYSLPAITTSPDQEFAVVTQTPLEDILRAPEQRQAQLAVAEPPAPASAAALLFWLVVLPGAAAAGLGTMMARRRRAAFVLG